MATVASGGTAPFSLAAHASAVIERRTVPGERAADTVQEVEALIKRLQAADPTVDPTVRLSLAREAWELDGSAASTELAGRLASALVAAGSAAPQRFGAPYWMESALWQEAGVSDGRLRPGGWWAARRRGVGGPEPAAGLHGGVGWRRRGLSARDCDDRAMSAQLDVLTEGYVGDRVAGTVVLIRDGDLVAVVDPGMVADRLRILGPLDELGIAPER